MIVELDLICRKMSGNIPVVQCLEEMSRRCGDEDIENFVQIIILGKKQGNNLEALVRSGVEKIQRRIEMNYEIEGMIGAKRNEFGFMCVIPAGDYCLYAAAFHRRHGGDVWESSGMRWP